MSYPKRSGYSRQMRILLRFGATLLVVAAIAAVGSVGACSSGSAIGAFPEGGDEGATPLDGGPPDDASTGNDSTTITDGPPPVTVSGTYYAELLSQLAFGNVARTFKFYGNVAYDASSKTITKIDLTPIKATATTISSSETTGTTVTKTSVPVAASGRFVAALGTVTIPADANPITGREIVIEDATLIGAFASPGRFCSQMTGHVTVPVDLQLEQDRNVVLYDPAKNGDAQPARVAADFVCTVPAN